MKCEQISYYKTEMDEIEAVYFKGSMIDYPEHNHVSVYTIGIILDGNINLNHEGKTRKLEAGDVYLILPYEPHAVYADESPYSMLSICFKTSLLDAYDYSKIFSLLLGLWDELLQMEMVKKEYLDRVLKVVGMLSLETRFNNIKSSKMYEAGKWIEASPELDICNHELAGKVYISQYHFIREFKKIIGLTPHKFQLQNRIRKAQHLLREGINITEVAMTVGFYDQSHFIKCFRQVVGVSPREFVAACRIKSGD